MRRKLGETAVSLKGVIFGKEGTRKSNTAIQMAMMKNKEGKPLKVLLLDCEYKAIEGFNESFLEKNGVNFGNICEIRTRDLDVIQQLCSKFTDGKPIPVLDENDSFTNEYEKDSIGNDFIADVLIIDSLTVIQDLMIEGRQEVVSKRTNIKIIKEGLFGDEKELAIENSGLQFLDYSKLSTKARKLVRDLQAVTGKHVFYIVRAKDAKKSNLVNGKLEQVDLGYEILDATSFKFLGYEVSLIIHTENDREGHTKFSIEKDSTGVYKEGDTFDSFNMLDYEPYINNTHRNTDLKVKSYSETIKKAKTFTEDLDENDPNDIKMNLYKEIVEKGKDNKENATTVKNYCKKNNIASFNNPELISVEDLVEIKKMLV